MAELIQQFTDAVRDARGNPYEAFAYGEERAGGTWVGWLEFRPLGGGGALRAAREMTQPGRGALQYRASGLELVYP